MLKNILVNKNIEQTLTDIINNIHIDGPINPAYFEKLAYIKKYHSDIMEKYEKKLLWVMGLFYKTENPESLLGEVYSIYEDVIYEKTGKNFTPVQAHAYLNIHEKKYFSFSAPTSSGKSYLFRELIQNINYDVVIVVPSRALIAEYINTIYGYVDNSVLVLPFIENINIEKTQRRIFIITPERGVELFKKIDQFNIKLFLLDEAQISEENVRGMKFDAFVRRIDKVLPSAKKVFAHPFVENPDAQFTKHNIVDNSAYKSYQQHTVGKIFLSFKDGVFNYFSPYESNNESLGVLDSDIAEDILKLGGTLLVYISKNKIYDGEYITNFEKYIDLCAKITDSEALKLIDRLKHFIGANNLDKYSLLIEMMERGVVIHHGSIPLHARYIIEDFIKSKYARICFATATLIQGINMPFDVVWIDNFHNLPPLSLKNLIGRAGRTTTVNNFEFGYTIVKERNIKTFSERMNEPFVLKDISQIDEEFSTISVDTKDIVEAVKNDTFNDDLQLTDTQVERLKSPDIKVDIEYILNNILFEDKPITGKKYYKMTPHYRNKIKKSFSNIYVKHLRKDSLSISEKTVLSAAIPIMLWHIQGKSFSEMVSLRYAYLTEKDKRRKIISKIKTGELLKKEAKKMIDSITVKYSPIASMLPDSNLRKAPLFYNTTVKEFDYDTLVYDTYDYLDKVISLSLVVPITAAFQLYYEETGDGRALIMKNYIRYGTNDSTEIWLLKYGFSFEDIEWLVNYIVSIDENGIVFEKSIDELDQEKKKMIDRYI